ncbi:hypothetical protein F0562_017634 [Nyssa sinensis]|uniref:Uncharacterized protein n=1 Tax=Nyssa sinensis TaxID=561372 RepID=A0A5J4ZFQ7_9ASTE|nr:hypothetical protein F0562_017634 [Nyssa sinensis]
MLPPTTSSLDLSGALKAPKNDVSEGLMVFEQFTGVNGIGFYATETFVAAGSYSYKRRNINGQILKKSTCHDVDSWDISRLSANRSFFLPQGAYDPLDPFGNITINNVLDTRWVCVTMSNFQMFQHIMTPGWTLGWTWAKKEVIWFMVGAQATEQGDCSNFKGAVSHCCGVVAARGQDPSSSVSAFQVSVCPLCLVRTRVTCGPAKIVPSRVFLSADGRQKSQGLMTWNVTCTYSQFLATKNPTSRVSSSFHNDTIIPCLRKSSKKVEKERKAYLLLAALCPYLCLLPPCSSCACGFQNKNGLIIEELQHIKQRKASMGNKVFVFSHESLLPASDEFLKRRLLNINSSETKEMLDKLLVLKLDCDLGTKMGFNGPKYKDV